MREMDNNPPETAKRPGSAATSNTLRVHRGALGQVLQRYLSQQRPQQEYSLARLENLWQQAAELDPAIGLHLFAEFTPADWHVLLHLAQVSSNVGEALQHWQRYARLASDMEQVRVTHEGERIAIDLVIDAPSELERYLVEHYSVMATSVLREGAGIALSAMSGEFRHARPAYHTQYAQWFGPSVRFNAAHNRLYLDTACLTLPMRQHHPVLVELLREGLDRRMARLQHLNGWAAQVATQVRQDLQQQRPPSLEAAADALHQSPRTLRRRLQEQGLGFREVLDSVRSELEQSLQLQSMNSSQIAEQLGYADSAAYLHARKRWQTSTG
ncbi:MAG: AraC family transcriptional regulator ligand-binding domain-containing protein [Pseudomonas sp.]|uniref:AraC family transcriptional regulator ligand-binding domain-containing protein n=1 Tax=Pseudomonas sp. TaxID=306 RepID=UPI003981B8FE